MTETTEGWTLFVRRPKYPSGMPFDSSDIQVGFYSPGALSRYGLQPKIIYKRGIDKNSPLAVLEPGYVAERLEEKIQKLGDPTKMYGNVRAHESPETIRDKHKGYPSYMLLFFCSNGLDPDTLINFLDKLIENGFMEKNKNI